MAFRCSLSCEHLTALHQADRTIGLPVKYGLVPAMLLGAYLFHPAILHRTDFYVGLALALLGTIALHVAYARAPGHERPQILGCVTLECFFVVLVAAMFDAPLESLCAFPMLKVTMVMVSVEYQVSVVITSLAAVMFGALCFHSGRILQPDFWWGMLSVGMMLASSLILGDRMRRTLCPNCIAARLHSTRLRQQIQIQEDERRRIARELHDSRSQNLAALIIYLDMLRDSIPPELALRTQVDRTREIAGGMLDDVRRLIQELRPALLDDLGLEAAIRQYIRSGVEPTGIKCTLTTDGLGERLRPEVEIAVYRIVQEALSNVVRHSGAANVSVSVTHTGDRVSGAVTDDGKGFDTSAQPDPGKARLSFGLVGISERALMLHGNVSVVSKSGHGTSIIFDVPTTEQTDA